ncbi:CBFD-NFYB-HMF domain-containing protein [Mycena chlorophos]|uniref:CBFD-NFYB-HMF domain-containing protein n=1 Tax=Mycena chlorophos TaxID=658473 RepID=A0A8H6RZL2_MYCCL|nr:CBFD-NFYB-HMF domain-containing protein [Mycena chlorophos]
MDVDSAAQSVASEPPMDMSDDDETDQLAFDDMDEDPLERIPGEPLLPSDRLENIIKAHGVLGSLALSKEGLFMLSVAAEEFIHRLVQGGHRQANAERRTTINYRDMASTTQQYQEFMFLRETIPLPVSAKEAMELREAKEREMIANDPALLDSTNQLALNGSAQATFVKFKSTKAKTNGKEPKANGKEPKVNGKEPKANGKEKAAKANAAASSSGTQSRTADRPSTSTSAPGSRSEGWTRWAGTTTNFPTDPRLNGLLANANAHTLQAALAAQAIRNGETLPVSSLLSNPYQRTTSLWSNSSTPSIQQGAATPDPERAPLVASTSAKPAHGAQASGSKPPPPAPPAA